MLKLTFTSFTQLLRTTLLTVLIASITLITPAQAAVSSPASPKITFSFDDGRATNITKSAPILAKYGLSATAYITTGCVGMTKTPNTCHAANDVSYMTWAQIKTLKNTYNWEIGSHSKTHPYMASTNASDGQPKRLTNAQIISELNASKADLAAQGITATAYASPYGDYNPFVLQELAKTYSSHRGFADQNDNVWPYNDILLNNMQVQTPVTTAAVKAKIDYAIAHNTWLVLTLHDVVDKPSSDINKYQWGTAQLDSIAAYVKAKRDAGLLSTINASGGLATGTTNLMPGSDFTSGIANGWRTDQPSLFVANTASNGSYPEKTYSIRINPNTLTKDVHLFSPPIPVDANTRYLIKSYLNVTTITRGEIGYYIDEYDSSGNWVSGQYKAHETGVFAENINLTYVPTSLQVKKASLQIYSTASSQASGYFDSIRWYAVSTNTTAPQNLMVDGSFDNPWAQGWTTDDAAAITRDTGSHGSPNNPVNSIAVHTTSGTRHLFSPKIGVDATKSYYLENYLNITSNPSGEVGIYIDEYNSAGGWVSGQYKATITSPGVTASALTYSPTSTQVTTIRVQYIFSTTSTFDAYLDDSRLYNL